MFKPFLTDNNILIVSTWTFENAGPEGNDHVASLSSSLNLHKMASLSQFQGKEEQ